MTARWFIDATEPQDRPLRGGEEIFAPVPGHPGYFVGDRGTVLSTKRGRLHALKGLIKSNGYISVNLDSKTRTVHPLVAEAFIGPRPDGQVVCHNDGTRVNNDVSNLRWGTQSDNVQDAIRHGTIKAAVPRPPRRIRAASGQMVSVAPATHCRRGLHPYDEQNTVMRRDGGRRCRACRDAFMKSWKRMRRVAA